MGSWLRSARNRPIDFEGRIAREVGKLAPLHLFHIFYRSRAPRQQQHSAPASHFLALRILSIVIPGAAPAAIIPIERVSARNRSVSLASAMFLASAVGHNPPAHVHGNLHPSPTHWIVPAMLKDLTMVATHLVLFVTIAAVLTAI